MIAPPGGRTRAALALAALLALAGAALLVRDGAEGGPALGQSSAQALAALGPGAYSGPSRDRSAARDGRPAV